MYENCKSRVGGDWRTKPFYGLPVRTFLCGNVIGPPDLLQRRYSLDPPSGGGQGFLTDEDLS